MTKNALSMQEIHAYMRSTKLYYATHLKGNEFGCLSPDHNITNMFHGFLEDVQPLMMARFSQAICVRKEICEDEE